MVLSYGCEPAQFSKKYNLLCAAEFAPLGESGGAAGLEIVSAGERALSIEVVVD